VICRQVFCFDLALSEPSHTHVGIFIGIGSVNALCRSAQVTHMNDHRTSSFDCGLHKLMNTILCDLKNLKDLLSLSPLIIINNILSGVLAIIAFYLTFFCSVFYYIVLYGIR